MDLFTQGIVTLLFAIVAIAVLGWVGYMIPELREWIKQHKFLQGIMSLIFSAAPAHAEVEKSSTPIKVTVEGLLPLILWLLIVLPMFIFPIILIIFPMLHIPWSYLLPP